MSDLVTDRQPCPEHEKQDLLAYLSANSHVQLPVQMIESGYVLETGKVEGAAKIGQLQTCFRALGHARAADLHGREFFSVAEALVVFLNPGPSPHPDVVNDAAKIRRYRDLLLARIPIRR